MSVGVYISSGCDRISDERESFRSSEGRVVRGGFSDAKVMKEGI